MCCARARGHRHTSLQSEETNNISDDNEDAKKFLSSGGPKGSEGPRSEEF